MNPGVYAILFICVAVAIMFSSWVMARHLSASRQVQAELESGKRYLNLADEYRRLSDMAITGQEHSDLRLASISVRIDELKDQLDRLQSILKEVELGQPPGPARHRRGPLPRQAQAERMRARALRRPPRGQGLSAPAGRQAKRPSS
jgi:hypothetical protein